jgi:hypothetical protein
MAKSRKPVSDEEKARRIESGKRLAAARAEKEAALLAENERLRAALAARETAPARIDPDAVVPIKGTFIDEAKDDLDWIDDDVHAVHLVSKNMSITLRPADMNQVPIVSTVMIHSHGSGPWLANPFDLRSNHPDVNVRATTEKLNEIRNANWGYFVISRQLAEGVFSDPRFPVPSKAVVSAAEFRGYDREVHRAVGKYRDLGPSPDKLREAVRMVLQRMRGTCFIDASRHGPEIASRRFDARRPNPYGMALGNIVARLPEVKTEGATA